MPSILGPVLAVLGMLSVTASASCTVTNGPGQKGLHCAQKATLKTPYPIQKFTSTSGDMTSCRDTCLDDASCISFSFDSVSQQCVLYSDTLINQGWTKSLKSTTTYWNRRCFIRLCTSDSAPTITDAPDPGTTPFDPGNSDPNAVPADPSGFTATYAPFSGFLPTFTDPIPSLAGIVTATPVPQCIMDPTNGGTKFEILNSTGGPLVYQPGNPAQIGLLRLDQIPHSEAAMKAYKYPQFHFEKPARAPNGFFDLVIEDPTHGNLYLAREGYGAIYLVSKSSNGQIPKNVDGKTVVTTIWGVSCDGKLTVGTTDTSFIWTPKGKYTVAQPGDPSAVKPFLLLPANAQMAKRNAYQDGSYARCIPQPTPLFADVKQAKHRAPQSNGCGSDSTAAFVPDLDFGNCCNHHDLCYDDCAGGFKDQCDDSFQDCMHSSCDSDFGAWYEYPLLLSCYRVADFYHLAVAGLGGSSFTQSTIDRCQCYCNDRANNQLCADSSGNPSCIFVKGADNNNCGACGQTCPSYAHCAGGNCKCNQDTCDGGLCLSLQNHPRNCGACGNVCASGYCYQGHCYDPPPPSPTSCTPKDSITNGGFDNWNLSPFYANSGNAYISGDEGHGPDVSYSSGNFPLIISQDIIVCPGSSYTFTMLSYSWSGSCSVTVSLNGRQILSQGIQQRNHDADPLGSIGPGNLYIDPNDGAYTQWGVSRNATLTMSFSCGGYTTVYADSIAFYAN